MAHLNVDSNLAKLRFQSFRLTVPPPQGLIRPAPPVAQRANTGVRASTGSALRMASPAASSQSSARSGASGATATPMTLPPALFLAASNSRADVDRQAGWTQEYGDYIDAICEAIRFAHRQWKQQAKLRNLRIDASAATGGPGCVEGPELEGMIKHGPGVAAGRGLFGSATRATNAIARGISKAFKQYQDHIVVPGLWWYPAFVAFPAAMAPPMPNTPSPLISMPSTHLLSLRQDAVVATMKAELGGASFPFSDELFTSVADAFEKAMMMWIPAQMVMMVMGKGPVPAFAPPYVPVGPVLGGDIISMPGHFAS